MSLKGNHKLCLLMPTNTPEVYNSIVRSSWINLIPISPYIKISINFQPPWTEDAIKDVVEELESLGFNVVYSYNSYEIKKRGEVPFNRIRNDTYLNSPDSEYYMITDDDFWFYPQSAYQLLDDIEYLDSHPECHIIYHVGNKRRFSQLNDSIIEDDFTQYCLCNEKGIVFRNEQDSQGNYLFPRGSEDLVGSDEEKVLIACRLALGSTFAVHPKFKIRHWESHKSQKTSGALKYNWNLDSIRNRNNFKFIRDNYSPEFTVQNRKLISVEFMESQHQKENKE